MWWREREGKPSMLCVVSGSGTGNHGAECLQASLPQLPVCVMPSLLCDALSCVCGLQVTP